MDTIIQTQDLTRRFGGLVAVNEVNFSVERGEVRGLIGPNGSGKTTLINLISGVCQPPNRIAQKGLMRTFQIPRLFGSMTLLENMLIPRFANFSLDYLKQRSAAEQRAQELLEMAGIVHLRDHQAKTLSGGQKALLQMARGFMVEEMSVFLLDEPFAGVNIIVKETIMTLIGKMAAEGITFILVSHEMASIRQMCQKVTVLAEGSIIIEGTMDEIAADQQVIDAYLGGGA
jgi:branched-chain amino acid transport system ATP-binding protein